MRPKRARKKRGGFFLALFLLATGFTGGMAAAGALAVYFSELPLPLITPPTRDGGRDVARQRERERRETLEFHNLLRQDSPPPVVEGLEPVPPDGTDASDGTDAPADSGAPDSAAVAEPPAPETFVYHLQVAAFRDRDRAETMRGQLALVGREAVVKSSGDSGAEVWRVQLGPFADEREAEEQRALLALEGYNNVSLLKTVRQ